MQIALKRGRLFPALTILIAALCAPQAQAAESAALVPGSPEYTVRSVYHNYAWQAIGGAEAFGSEAVNLRRQSLQELEKYFEPGLAELIRKASECEEKTKRACTPDFDYIFGSHSHAATELDFQVTKKNVVQVSFWDAVYQMDYSLEFKMVDTAAGWRIADIHYQNRKTGLRDALLKAAPGKPLAQPKPSAQTADTPESTVRRLYRDYAWEGVGYRRSDGGMTSLQGQALPELKKYFENGLAGLLRADRECTERVHTVCNLDGDVIFASQDPMTYGLKIFEANKRNQVLVTFTSSGKLVRLRYDMVKTEDGWRIYDLYELNTKYHLRGGMQDK